jgi:hypothetical protein
MFAHLLNDLHTIQLNAGGQVSLLRPAIWVCLFLCLTAKNIVFTCRIPSPAVIE